MGSIPCPRLASHENMFALALVTGHMTPDGGLWDSGKWGDSLSRGKSQLDRQSFIEAPKNFAGGSGSR